MMFLEKFMRFSSQFVNQWLLPPLCILCSSATKRASNICWPCQQGLPILSHYCQQCARFLPANMVIEPFCGACLTESPPYSKIFALFPYEEPIIRLIIELKFQAQLTHARAFGELLAEKIANVWYAKKPLPDLIIPIPLHIKRLRERGFNQAIEIARPIAKQLNLAIHYSEVTRVKETVPQSSLPGSKRKENVARAFHTTGNYHNKIIAIIDDVITTGYTVNEFSRLLKQHGAKRIDVWCVARRG